MKAYDRHGLNEPTLGFSLILCGLPFAGQKSLTPESSHPPNSNRSVREVDSVTAYGNYLKVQTRGKTFLLRDTINNLSRRLDPAVFLRIHRSTIVNAERIKEFQPIFDRQYAVILEDGSEFVLSRNYRKEILSRFE